MRWRRLRFQRRGLFCFSYAMTVVYDIIDFSKTGYHVLYQRHQSTRQRLFAFYLCRGCAGVFRQYRYFRRRPVLEAVRDKGFIIWKPIILIDGDQEKSVEDAVNKSTCRKAGFFLPKITHLRLYCINAGNANLSGDHELTISALCLWRKVIWLRSE